MISEGVYVDKSITAAVISTRCYYRRFYVHSGHLAKQDNMQDREIKGQLAALGNQEEPESYDRSSHHNISDDRSTAYDKELVLRVLRYASGS